ncbi:MAG: Spy/CpxP family protein refolding chaperone [Syntrophobacteraceae bacterium]
MKKSIVACHFALLVLGWFFLSWFFFDSIAFSAPCQRVNGHSFENVMHDGPGHNWHHHRGGHSCRMLMDELNLSDEQESQIHSILSEERPNVKPLIQQLKQGREQFDALAQDGTFDEARVRAVAVQQAAIITELMVMKERTKAKVLAVLTAEQRAEARELLHSMFRPGPGGFMH